MGSLIFKNNPRILASAAVGGPFEAKGALAQDFDLLYPDLWLGKKSFEQAQTKMLEDALKLALRKASLQASEIEYLLAGDLLNQITSGSFAARSLGIPFAGLYGACSTSMEGLALAAQLVDSGQAQKVLCGTVSHNAATEKQFRYPTEYGSQKPPVAQWTVTAAGAAVVGQGELGIRITSATLGKVIDLGITDPFNMGGAMAPAAVDTISRHLTDLNRQPQDYALILTGDLGRIGREIALELFKKQGLKMAESLFMDCGLLIYQKEQPVQAGGSGCGCSASVVYGHILKQMQQGKWPRVLVVATGALLSPLTCQQKESIPGIAHAVCLEI